MDLPVNQIIQADSLAYLPTLPAECVDLVFADPPYNLQLRKDLWRPNLTKVDAVDNDWDKFEGDDTQAIFESYDDFTRAWLSGVRHVMKDDATLWVSGTYHNIFRVGAIMQDMGFWVLNTITWFKPNAMPNFNGTRLKNDVEFVIWAKKSEKSRYTFHHHMMKQFNDFSPGKQLGSVWKINVTGGEERLRDSDGKVHPTQKPEELLKRIIVASSNPGDVVLDPFVGSGTTAAMAKHLRRRWVGIDSDAYYVAIARDRLDTIVKEIDENDPLIKDAIRQKPPRVAFEKLLDEKYVQVNQSLYLDQSRDCAATVRADGTLYVNGDHDLRGSIHQVGKWLKGTPSCNGWKHWYFEDESGELRPIDDLRKQYRQEVASTGEP